MRLPSRQSGFLLATVVAALRLLLDATPAYAADAVVTDCASDADLRDRLTAMQGDGGGVLTFDCAEPADPNVIVLTAGTLPDIVSDVTVDGGGAVTLSGGNATRHFFVGATGSLTLKRIGIVKGLAADDGGAIFNEGSLTILDSRFRENESTGGSGGAIVTYGPTTIANSEFDLNKALNGGALYARWQAVVNITASNFHDNEATGAANNGLGGALLAWDGPKVTIESSMLRSNKADYNGGAIQVTAGSALTLTASTLEFNQAVRFHGSAVVNNGTALISRSLLYRNNSDNKGDFAAILNYGDLTLVNSTLAENQAGLASGGTAAEVAFSTIVQSMGSGVWVGVDGTIQLKNSIVAGNGANCSWSPNGAIQSQGFNIESDDTCQLNATGDRPNTDPLLGNLFDWGGPTESYLPEEGSPALDNGQCSGGVDTDQRGSPRPDGAGCDIGVVEAQHYTLTVTPTGDGLVTSDPAGIECGDFCTVERFEWTTIALTATPDDGFTFTGWNTNACAGAGTGVCNVIMVRPATASPTFVAEGQQVFLPAVQK